MAALTTDELLQAMRILDACRRQATLSSGSWRCHFWRQEHVSGRYGRYPAPWHVDPAECMVEKYQAASNTLFAVFAS